MARFPAYLRRQHQHIDSENVKRATQEHNTQDTETTGSAGTLRGIPAIAQGVPGAINGTAPHHSVR